MPKDMDVDLVLALSVIARAVKADWLTWPDLDWLPYTFGEGLISVLPTSASLRRASDSGDWIGENCMLMTRPIHH